MNDSTVVSLIAEAIEGLPDAKKQKVRDDILRSRQSIQLADAIREKNRKYLLGRQLYGDNYED